MLDKAESVRFHRARHFHCLPERRGLAEFAGRNRSAVMQTSDIRLALFTGNYNYVRDGANPALNRLVGYLLDQGVAVRIYSPTITAPAFEPVGDLVGIPSFPFPGRGEYRVGTGLPRRVRQDIAAFRPNLVHIASPDILGHRAVAWAGRNGVPAVASFHPRFEPYFRYYRMAWLQTVAESLLRRLYQRCEEIYAPSESMAAVLHDQRMSRHIADRKSTRLNSSH